MNLRKGMIMKKEKEMAKEPAFGLFQDPTAQYRAVPFWSWNCRVTEETIDKQLAVFKSMGFGGVDIHPRTGMETEYLSREYMELVAHTVEKCREMGLFCWLYDEDRFPSGSAGGIVTRNNEYRGRFLLLTERERTAEEGFWRSRTAFEEAAARGEEAAGYYVTAYGLAFREGRLAAYHRLESREEISDARRRGEKIRYAYVKLLDKEAWFEEQSYVDTMNPEAIKEFIRVTHEAYYQKVGVEFGHTVPAVFTDEPRMGRHLQISRAASEEDVAVPYTDYLEAQLRERYGIELLDIVPEYVWERADIPYSVNRYRYRDMCAECFVSAYMDQLCQWCAEHGIAMTGHVLSEETLGSQAFVLGDCMRCYRHMDLPGIDILADRREFATVKQAVSVSRQKGRRGTVSELYGVTHWDCDFKTFKLQGDWQAALGITVRIPHLSHMSLQGEAKRDWPGSIFFQAPWYEKYPYIEDYFSRLNTVLTRGTAVVNLGVIHPIESMWMYMGPDDQTLELRREMDEDFSNMIKWLLFGAVDFDFLSEALLPELSSARLQASVDRFIAGKMSYSAVLVPNMVTIRSTTLELLERFKERGGTIIFMGRIPELVDGQSSPRAYELAKSCICVGKSRNELLAALEADREVRICRDNGLPSENLIYQLRQEEKVRWLFICHVEPAKHSASVQESYKIQIKGEYQVTLYDALTGDIRSKQAVCQKGFTEIECRLYAEDSVLYRLEEGKDRDSRTEKKPEGNRTEKIGALLETEKWHRQEKNVLLLDYARYRIEDGPLQKREEILRLDNQIREQLGFVRREEGMCQPYHLSEGEVHKVTLVYSFVSEISTEASLAIEEVEGCRIWLNGAEADRTVTGYYVDPAISVISLPDIREGENELTVEVAYHQKRNLENIYVLGEFNVELRGICPVITSVPKKLTVGDITRQGMPFYTGNLEYYFSVAVEEAGEYTVHIPHFKAPVLEIRMDGRDCGLMAYAPHRVSVGWLEEGVHELCICLYGNRFNGFGTLHNANDHYIWYGPDSYRTRGDEWTDDYRIRPAGLLSAVELERVIPV